MAKHCLELQRASLYLGTFYRQRMHEEGWSHEMPKRRTLLQSIYLLSKEVGCRVTHDGTGAVQKQKVLLRGAGKLNAQSESKQ